MKDERQFHLTLFQSLGNTRIYPKNRKSGSWSNLLAALNKPPRVSKDRSDVQLISGATFKPDSADDFEPAAYRDKQTGERIAYTDNPNHPDGWYVGRGNGNLEDRDLLILDYDSNVHYRYFISKHLNIEYFLYTSYNNGKDGVCKFRVVLPLASPVDAKTFDDCKLSLIAMFKDADKASFTGSQAFFLPCVPEEPYEEFHSYHSRGELFNFNDKVGYGALLKRIEREDRLEELDGQNYSKTSLGSASRKVMQIDPDVSYDTWIAIGMALKNEYGENGYEIFEQWTESCVDADHQHRKRNIEQKYRSFRENDPREDRAFSLGTIRHFAKENSK